MPRRPARGRAERRGHRALSAWCRPGTRERLRQQPRPERRVRLAGGGPLRGRQGLPQHAPRLRPGARASSRRRAAAGGARARYRRRRRRSPGRWDWTGRVRFVGTREDVPEFMTVADGYVMSSAWEGMPMVLLEAAAAGPTHRGDPRRRKSGGGPGRRSPGSWCRRATIGRARRSDASPHGAARDRAPGMGARGHDHVRQHYGLGPGGRSLRGGLPRSAPAQGRRRRGAA